jgi:hypothetical protein
VIYRSDALYGIGTIEKRHNRDTDDLSPADNNIALRAPAMAFDAPNGAAEFFCISKNLHTRKSLRPFVPFLEVAQVLQIAGSVSSPEDAAQATNDWRPQHGYSTRVPNLTTKKAC